MRNKILNFPIRQMWSLFPTIHLFNMSPKPAPKAPKLADLKGRDYCRLSSKDFYFLITWSPFSSTFYRELEQYYSSGRVRVIKLLEFDSNSELGPHCASHGKSRYFIRKSKHAIAAAAAARYPKHAAWNPDLQQYKYEQSEMMEKQSETVETQVNGIEEFEERVH